MRRFLVLAAAGALVGSPALLDVPGAALAAEVVENPAAPAQAPQVLHPAPVWSLGGESEAEDEFFGVVRRAAVGADGTTYLLDEQLHEVRAVDARGKVVARFGREGGGPGEFTRPRDVFVLADGRVGVVHGFPARISTFGADGSIGPDLSVGDADDPAMILELQAAGGHLVAVRNRMQRNDTTARITRTLVELGTDGRPLRTYLEQSEEVPMAGNRGRGGPGPRMMMGDDFLVSWAVGADGRLFLARHTDRYEIEVLAPDGTAERTIRRAYTRVARSAGEIANLEQREAAIAERTGGSPREVDRHRNDIARVIARADGSVWVLPSSGLARDQDGVLGIFDVFDTAGRFVRQVEIAVPFDPAADEFELVGDTLFVFEQAVDAARSMTAGRGGGMFTPPAAEESEEEGDPLPLRIVRYQLAVRS